MTGAGLNITGYQAPMFQFEEQFDHDTFHTWMIENWKISYLYSALYVVFIFSVQRYMKDRERYELRVPLVIWSSLLAVFSIGGMVRTVPETIHQLQVHGFAHSICDNTIYYGQPSLWGSLFVRSKLFELGDTAFIVFRKQPLIVLHWYHHVTVMIYSWSCYADHTGPARWFMVLNYTVHSFMYTYYALRAMKFRLPRIVNVTLTMMQLIQMVMGMVVILKAHSIKSSGGDCQVGWENLRYGMLIYSSYFVLFAWFFYSTYIRRKPVQHKAQVNGSHRNSSAGNIQNGKDSIGKGTISNGITTHANENGTYVNGSTKKDD